MQYHYPGRYVFCLSALHDKRGEIHSFGFHHVLATQRQDSAAGVGGGRRRRGYLREVDQPPPIAGVDRTTDVTGLAMVCVLGKSIPVLGGPAVAQHPDAVVGELSTLRDGDICLGHASRRRGVVDVELEAECLVARGVGERPVASAPLEGDYRRGGRCGTPIRRQLQLPGADRSRRRL